MIATNILVNLISLFQGGPKVVCFGILEGVEELLMSEKKYNFCFICPDIVEVKDKVAKLEKKFAGHITIKHVKYPHSKFKVFSKLYLDHIYTAYTAKKYNADFIFMTANFASLFSGKFQIVLMHNLHYLVAYNPFSKISTKIRFALEKRLFIFTLKRKPFFVLQTHYTKNKMKEIFNISSALLDVIYMMPPKDFILNNKDLAIPALLNKKDCVKLFLPAKYHPNKNFGLLKDVAYMFIENGMNAIFFVTLKDSEYKILLEKDFDILSNYIINLGEIKYSDIQLYYKNVDMLFFPSSAESYGFPYIEAILCNKAIATTNSAFSRELVGESGYFFDLNKNSIFNAIKEYAYNPKPLNYTILSNIPTWEEYMMKVISIYENKKQERL
jgi:hypothetical protein